MIRSMAQQNTFFSLEQVIDRQPLTVAPETPLHKVIRLMHEWVNSCLLPHESRSGVDLTIDSNNSCALVLKNSQLQGIFTERDLLRLVAAGKSTAGVTVGEVMSRDLITLNFTSTEDIFTAINLLRSHRIQHLPVIDRRNCLLGLITAQSICQNLVLEPAQMYGMVEPLQRQVSQLKLEKTEYLQQRHREVAKIEQQLQQEINQRQQIEAELRRTHQQLFLHINNSPLAVVEWDSNFRVKRWSQRAEQLFGWQESEVLGKHWRDWEFVFTEDFDSVTEVTDRLLDGTYSRNISHNRNYAKDGSVIDCEWYSSVLRDDSGKLSILTLLQDISQRQNALRERQRTESALQKREKLLRVLVTSVPVGIFQTDAQGDCLFVNAKWQEMTGLSDAEATGEGWVKALHPEDGDRVYFEWYDAAQTGREFNLECRFANQHQDRVIWVDARAVPLYNEQREITGYLGTVTEIGDHKRRENILKDIASGVSVEVGENFFHSLVEFLSKTLQVNFAFVSKLIGAEVRRVETLAVYGKGESLDNFVYLLANAPCGNVIEQGLCIYPEAVKQLFPDIPPLEVMEAESYAGMPIFDAAGNVLGLVAVVDSKPFADVALIEEVLKIFATRASTELERQQAELTLLQSEQKFRAIFDHTFQFIGLLEPDGKTIEANRTSLDYVGLTPEDVRGKPFWETPWWSRSLEARVLLQRGIERAAEGEFVRFEVEHLGTENRVITVDFSLTPIKDETGKVIMLIPEGRNISDRQQAEQKIREQAALLDIATDAIMVRRLDNKLVFWNHGAERLYGWTKAEALTEDVESLLYRQSLSRLTEIQQVAIERGEWQGELNHVTKVGKEILVKSRWTLVTDDAGNPQSYLIVNTDITEQKQLEVQFLRTQRLESLGTLAGGIAHDLNNILVPILGFSKLLPLKLPNVDEQTKGFFKIMENNANRGTALVKQILTFSRGLEGDKGIVQIRHLIVEIEQIIRETFPKSIELVTNIPQNLWTINADINQLHQVLMNLSVNARDAMLHGGTLTIHAENTTVDAEYARLHLDAQAGSYVLITVTDTGVGIAPEVIDRIFEPFFTTKEIGRGTGLGLSTVIGIIKSHDGFIDVVSNKNSKTHGTQFKVFLPASDMFAIEAAEIVELPHGNGELILVVDDEPAILKVTQATLETYNYQVLTANDGIEAIAVYAQNQQEIEVVVMDMMMPLMDGKTSILTLKKINPEVKIIAISGLIERQKITTETDSNITSFLAKPYSNDDLLQKIHEIICNTRAST